MNIWQVLEIEKTNDINLIKKAYSKKIKFCKPEKDPAGFQQLRDAYEIAIKFSEGETVNEELGKSQEIPNLAGSAQEQSLEDNPVELALYVIDLLYKDETAAVEFFEKLIKKGIFDNLAFSENFQNVLAVNLLTAMPRYQGFVRWMLDYFNWDDDTRKNSFYGIAISSLIIQVRPYRFLNYVKYLSTIKNKKEAKKNNLDWYKCYAAKVLMGPLRKYKFFLISLFPTKKRKAISELFRDINNNFPEVIGIGLPIPTWNWWAGYLRKGYMMACFAIFIMLTFGFSIYYLSSDDGTPQSQSTISANNKKNISFLESQIPNKIEN